MDDAPTRVRRRLRQRSPQTDAPPRQEIISLDSSSDAFELNSSDNDSDSDSSSNRKSKRVRRAPLAAKKRGFKRLRRPEGETTQEDTSQKPTPAEPEEWECVRCTYLNEPQRMACEICASARSMPKQTRKLSAWLATSAPSTAKTSSGTKAKGRTTTSAGRDTKAVTMETIDSSDEGESQRSASMSQSSQRQRRATTSGETDELWTASSVAQSSTIDELCVQKKKVQEVQAWLQQSVPSVSVGEGMMMKRLVFVCGPPGSGKSTTVRHLANVMGVDVKEWRDNATAGRLQYHRYLRDEFQLTQVSAWDDFIDFINRSINYSALQVAAVPDTCRYRKRALDSSANEPIPSSQARGQLILIESWPENPFGSQDTASWDEKLKTAFRQIVNPAANLRYPVVCIFSDVRDKKMDAVQLAKIFSDDVVHSPFTSVINFNPVTAAQMKKALVRMLDKMDCSVSPQELQKVIDSSNGDIRHATNMIQLLQKRQPLLQSKRKEMRKMKASDTVLLSSDLIAARSAVQEDEDDASRDPFFSDFHIVGKLLHSKNKMPDAASASSSSRFVAFDHILDSSAISLDRVLSLLHSNSPEYFTEIEDLEQAVGLMSLSEMWLHESYRTTSSSTAFKTSHGVVRSIAVRSIALTNEHPAPSAFRPITAPRTYEAAKRMIHCRQDVLRQLEAKPGAGDSTHAFICRGDVYAFEMQPFVDIMNRQHHSNHLTQMMGHQSGNREGEHALVDDDDIENSDGDGW